MRNKLTSVLYKLNTCRTADEKIKLMKEVLEQLMGHFQRKAKTNGNKMWAMIKKHKSILPELIKTPYKTVFQFRRVLY